MSRRTMLFGLVGVALVAALASAGSAAPGYLRYPDLNGTTIVFGAEGDLWVAPDAGGLARRLTSSPGTEYFPRFSPEGTRIAFTGEYDGNRDVYVIPAQGGEPRRLTWNPSPEEVLGWTPDGARILFRSRAENALAWELFSVAATGSDPEKLPLGWAARIAIDPQTGLWAFNRATTEGRTWKRYRGGTASDLWVGHPDRADFAKVSDFPGPQEFPMWHGGRLYFVCDQGGTGNIWSLRPDGSDRRRHTDVKGWDARWPAMSPDGRVVFTLGADIHVLSTADDTVRKVAVELPSDAVLTRTRYPEAGRTLTSLALSPKADRLAVVTRGEIFSVPVKDGPTLPVSSGSGARESSASFSPDGTRLVYVTDEPGEEEIRTLDAWGRGKPGVVRPAGASGWHYPPAWSPDGSLIAWADNTHALHVAPAAGGAAKLVDSCEQNAIADYAWSPDGRWLAYSKAARTDYSSIYLYDTRAARVHRLTGPYTNDVAPAWDPEGRYLYFLSDRSTNPVLDGRDLNVIEVKSTIPLMVLLRRDAPSPFAATKGLPDGEKAEEKGKDDTARKERDKGKEGDQAEKPPKAVAIDLDGIADRVVALPGVERGRYVRIAATAKLVYIASVPIEGMNEQPDIFDEAAPNVTLHAFDLEKKKLTVFTEGVSDFEVARKADKLAVMKKKGDIFVLDAGATAGDTAEAKVSLANVVVELDPREEWAQIYWEAWRRERDFYWDENLGGLDWKAIGKQYATLLPRLASRADLSDLVGELISELNTSHTYVIGGDPGVRAPRVSTGLLGADLAREGDVFRVKRILRGDAADGVRSPLAEPGVGVTEGSYILAVNHRPFAKGVPFLAALDNLAGKDVVLTVGPKPTTEGSRDVVVRPLDSEDELRYADWVRSNREYVAARTSGRIGYLHIPDMMAEGMTAFDTWYFPQLDKEGLVVDARWNGGGFVSEIILERLRRKVDSFSVARNGNLLTYPARTLNGPFVVLTNQFAGSDGDIFPAAVQLEKLAPVIGMRSWGGVVGIWALRPLVDGGILTEPEGAWNDPARGWTIENHGVDPDIVVENLPQDLSKGSDAQLDRAIAEVLRLRDTRPPTGPNLAPVRPRSRAAFAGELATQ